MASMGFGYSEVSQEVIQTFSPEQRNVYKAFEAFLEAEHFRDVLSSFEGLKRATDDVKKGSVYDVAKEFTSARAKYRNCLWKILDEKRGQEEYQEKKFSGKTVLVVGAGPVGLRLAIEAMLHGAEVTVVEKRTYFSRNNVLWLWPYAIADLYALAGKFFYPKLCSGNIHHIGIWRLQNLTLKICLLLGGTVHAGVEFGGVIPRHGSEAFVVKRGHEWTTVEAQPGSTEGHDESLWYAHFSSESLPQEELLKIQGFGFDTLAGCDGEKSVVAKAAAFTHTKFQAKTAIGITCNFVNHRKRADVQVLEFSSGRADVKRWSWFRELHSNHGIFLEDLVYYRDETHYLVFTVSKESLLQRGVLHDGDFPFDELLQRSNIDREALAALGSDVAHHLGIPEQFMTDHHGKDDIQVFDFTKKLQATTPFVVMHDCAVDDEPLPSSRPGLMVLLAGDSLVGPFWPQGTGANRGLCSVLDAMHYMALPLVECDCTFADDLAPTLGSGSGDVHYCSSCLAATQEVSLVSSSQRIVSSRGIKTPFSFSSDPFSRYAALKFKRERYIVPQ